MRAGSYRFVLEQSAFEHFTRFDPADADLLTAFFAWLTTRPFDTTSYSVADPDGRTHYGHLCGPYLVVAWTDHAAKEVRITQILRD